MREQRPSKTQIRKLGERLRDATGQPSPEDLAMLQAHVDAHQQLLERVLTMVAAAVDRDPTYRLKQVETIIEKLRRETSMPLSSMQDIAGVRIVCPHDSAVAQTDIAEGLRQRLAATFDVPRSIDRRTAPSHGYRAVHLIVQDDDLRLEIQIRLPTQHLWALTVEGLARRYGRGIQYGEPTEETAPLLGELLQISVEIAENERALDESIFELPDSDPIADAWRMAVLTRFDHLRQRLEGMR